MQIPPVPERGPVGGWTRAHVCSQRARVELSLSALDCTCDNARLRELLRDCPLLRLAGDVRCGDNQASFLQRGPDQLLCAYGLPCPPGTRGSVGGAGAGPRDSVLSRAVCAGCRCGVRLRGNASVVACEGAAPGAGWPGWAAAGAARPLALSVPGAGLRAVPRAALVELLAPNNSVAALDEADVPETLQVARSLSSEGATEEWNSRLRSFVEIERRLRPRLVAPRCWTCATTASSACRRRRRRGCAACARAWPGTPSPAPAATAPRSRACRTPT